MDKKNEGYALFTPYETGTDAQVCAMTGMPGRMHVYGAGEAEAERITDRRAGLAEERRLNEAGFTEIRLMPYSMYMAWARLIKDLKEPGHVKDDVMGDALDDARRWYISQQVLPGFAVISREKRECAVYGAYTRVWEMRPVLTHAAGRLEDREYAYRIMLHVLDGCPSAEVVPWEAYVGYMLALLKK